ncbi:uncharacterized protein EAF01_005633 [Botrytis porri]|uniref:Uncharacterized protein n=1 Tax=Botrytis porri TaxID=87229 RepID=A0A4Z1L529_9HELO|nr:uncharacterized protein EAF01_005633 [Botrytis porri]KAF7905112.1 hypothetical protein EAF01_005633 [Botrytis porri]TGO91912.1 hypothetical protein BPOR_0015g00220 [Botrytis porri]
MCIFRITTYDECWGQYTHLLICSDESSNNNELTIPQDRVLSALKCPNLKSEHINVGGSRCNCKINPQAFNTICKRMWGGDFVGSVNCSMNPGSAVKFQFRGREWDNCTNVDMLLRGGDRNVPDEYDPSAQAWSDREWDGDNKQVDWRDKDWVTLAEKGMVTWQSRKIRKPTNVQDPMISGEIQSSEMSQTYEEVQLDKSEMFSTEHNLTRPKGQKLRPRHTSTNRHVGTIGDAVVEWRRLKDQKEAAVDGHQNSSVSQPQYQRKASVPQINQAEHGRQLTIDTNLKSQQNALSSSAATIQTPSIFPTGPKAMPVRKAERLRRGRKNRQEIQSGEQSAASTGMRSTIPLGPKLMPVWQKAQILKEKQELEKKNIGIPPGNYQQNSMGPAAATATHDKNIHDQDASQVTLQIPASLETSSALVAASESSQDQCERVNDQKRNKFSHNAYEQGVVLREKKSKDQVHESRLSVQDGFQHVSVQTPSREDNNSSTNTLSKPWNGVPEYVVSQEYNNTLPESDDRNFRFNNYTPSKRPLEKVQMTDHNEASNSTPKDSYETLHQALRPQAAPHVVLDPACRGDLTPLELRQVERSQAKSANPEFHPCSSLSKIEQDEPQALEREQKTQDNVQTQRQFSVFTQEPDHSQQNFQRKAIRKLQEIEEQSKIPGNRNERDFLHDFSQLDAFLQDFTISQQDTAREMWMAEKAKVDRKYSKFYETIAAPGKAVTNSPQGSDKVVKQLRQKKVDEDNDFEEKSVEHGSLPRNEISPANTSRLSLKSELPHLLTRKRKTILLANMLHDQDMKERFVQDVPFQQQNVARDSWIIVAKLVDRRLQKLLDQIRTCVVAEGVENYSEDVEYNGEEHRQAQEKILKSVNRKFGEQLRKLERSAKTLEEKRVREAEKQKKLNHRKSFKEQNRDDDVSDLLNHNGRAEATSNQQELISTSLGDQTMGDILDVDEDADIKVQQKRKRDVQYLDHSPRMSAKKRKSGENKMAVESERARNQRLRTLYYSGLIPSMEYATGLEKADAAKLQVENKQDQDKRKDNSQYSEPITSKDEMSSNNKPQAQSSVRKSWIDIDFEAQDILTKTNRREHRQILIPETFHLSFQAQFPKLPNESEFEFRERKLAAFVVSDEYKQPRSAGSGTRNSTLTNGQEQADSDEDLSEYLPSELTRYTLGMTQSNLSNEAGTHAEKEQTRKPRLTRQAKTISAREEWLRKQDARNFEGQRQQVGNTGNARVEGMVGMLVGGRIDVDDQISSNMSDNQGLAGYRSEKNAYRKMEGGSRSQSRGVFGTEQQFQSFNKNLSAVVQHNDAVMAGSNIETAIDLTSD